MIDISIAVSILLITKSISIDIFGLFVHNMRLSHLDKKPFSNPAPRHHSPNSYYQKNNSNVSVHS